MRAWWSGRQGRASASARARAEAIEPIEVTEPVDRPVTFIARGGQTKGALPVSSDHLEGAVYSSRGRGYAPYNEDGAFLLRATSGALYLGAFDQAGGLGGLRRGEASGLAAEDAARAFRSIASGELDLDAARAELIAALEAAHQRLVAREQGEVTTSVLAGVQPDGRVLLANSGDSAALRFDARGRFVEMTPQHEGEGPLGRGCLTHAIGLDPEGPSVQTFVWRLEPGELLLLCSDGLLDAGLDRDEIGSTLAEAASLDGGVNRLVRRVLRRMVLYRAKPDNLTIVVARRRSPGPEDESRAD